MTKLGTELHPDDQRHVLNAYPYRMTHESMTRWPDATRQMRRGGFKMPIRSDQQWLAATYFKVRKDGRLDARVRRCYTTWPRGATPCAP